MFEKLLRIISRLRSKIIMKVLFIPVVRRRLEEIGRVYESDGIVFDADGEAIDRDMLKLNGKEEVRLNFTHYLPDTEKRIESFRRGINNRPGAIILHGSSLTELEERITELKDCDICYFGLNDFWVAEQNILQKINRNVSLIMCCGIPYDINTRINAIDFLERQEDNVLIYNSEEIRPLKRLP
ncbi:hypothetical protein ACFLTZ_00200 [Chloroflexota bacterium]